MVAVGCLAEIDLFTNTFQTDWSMASRHEITGVLHFAFLPLF